MAQKKKKTQAEKAVASKTDKKRSVIKKDKKNPSGGAKDNKQKAAPEKKANIPVRVITSVTFLGLFALLLILFLRPEGFVNEFFKSVILGLIGKAGFVVSIPVFLYLFVIHAFSGNRPVRMRTACLLAFVLIVGVGAGMQLDASRLSSGIGIVTDLYEFGATAVGGGILCGGLALILKTLLGNIVPYIILGIAALLTLLGGMQITVPSIIRAIQNRPRPDWEDKEPEQELQEPAAIVVNHIVNKQIAHKENQRKAKQQVSVYDPNAIKTPKTRQEKASDMVRQISELEAPVAAATGKVASAAQTYEDFADKTVLDEPVKPAPVPPVKEEQSVEKITKKDTEAAKEEIAQQIAQSESGEKPLYSFPPIELLKKPVNGALDGTAEMRENTRRLNETLASFKIEAHIINVTRGPSVTRYEVELEKGVRLNKLTTAADDIALSLGAVGVRIAAIPGKISVVGIEVPNRAVNTVSLREVIDSQEFLKAKSKSSFAVGKDIGGNCIVGNIARLPHMLIAGTTGSGKSVCMNSLIVSLLYKASPDDVKLIMVDPKMVELGIYNGIPHLLIPVVTDPKKAAGSLQWAVTEMMRRYKAMSDAGVRDLESYNSIIEGQEMDGKKMPQVVVIIDELADLMLVAAKEVEESICRIAQMGRAAGIHLVIATQRPSSDVITGLMKANIPSRIAFAVASAMESRIILDTMGAEKLVGKGDMLYAPIGNGKPKRVQGCFVSDPEVEAVASFVKNSCVTNYDQSVMEEIERTAAQTGNKQAATDLQANDDELGGDEMLPAAVDVILETGQASVSMLQRRLKLGYARAARIVDEMEEKGIVGPFQGSKPRTILVTKEQWQAMRSGHAGQMDFDDLEAENSEEMEDF